MVHRKIAMLFPSIVSTYFFYIMGESIAHPMCIKKHIPTNIYYILLVYMFYITTKPNSKKGMTQRKEKQKVVYFFCELSSAFWRTEK